LKLLERSEAQLIDFKDKRIAPAKLAKTVSAMANAEGGEIYIGITEKEDRQFVWDGFNNEEEANPVVQVVENMLYLNCHYEAEFFEYGDRGLVLRLIINKCGKVISTPEKKVYRRRNAQDLELKASEEIRQLELNKGVTSYEDFTINLGLQEVTESHIIYEFLLDNSFDMEPRDFLRKNNLIDQDKPRVSGLLLFNDYPQAYIDRCGVKIIRYNTSAEIPERKDMVNNPLTEEGCLYKLIYNTVFKVQEIVDAIPCTKQGEKMHYPQETLHEIITNAILHRDYSIKDDTQVRIFNNRVEVESPGMLPGYITIQNILGQRFSRNGTLVRIINKFTNPPNKDIGEGLNTAFNAMRDNGLMYPKIRQKENSVLVIIPNERIPNSTDVLLHLLESHQVLTAYEIERKRIFESAHEKQKTLRKLKEGGIIESVLGTYGNDTEYRLVRNRSKS
jgi:ATP-dependent DNA helicase RecG